MGCHFLLQGIFLTQGVEHGSPALAGGFFITEPPGKLSLVKSSAEGVLGSWRGRDFRRKESAVKSRKRSSVLAPYLLTVFFVPKPSPAKLKAHVPLTQMVTDVALWFRAHLWGLNQSLPVTSHLSLSKLFPLPAPSVSTQNV